MSGGTSYEFSAHDEPADWQALEVDRIIRWCRNSGLDPTDTFRTLNDGHVVNLRWVRIREVV